MSNINDMYNSIVEDNFPLEISLKIGLKSLKYKKRLWKVIEKDKVVERGLRYGDNPNQEAALYKLESGSVNIGELEISSLGDKLVSGLTEENMLQIGKHPSKTNLTDIDNALSIMRYLNNSPACVIMKHNNPCGVAISDDILSAYYKAFMADLIAAFGGIAVFNRSLTKDCADLISEHYLEVVVAPDYEAGALGILKRHKKIRIFKIDKIDDLVNWQNRRFLDIRSLMDGGIVLQVSSLNSIKSSVDLLPACCEYKGKIYETVRKPAINEIKDIVFGWAVEQGVTSNSVLYIKDGVTVAIGTGEQDRVSAACIAIYKAYIKYANILSWERYHLKYYELLKEVEIGKKSKSLLEDIDEVVKVNRGGLVGSVMISDGFFPFSDGVEVALKEGISCIAHPGGSKRDWESIEACNRNVPHVAMVFTGQRAFRH